MTIITRFAPSPTGFLHIGGARTALFNWLYARHFGGKFYLRVEDTDRARSTEAATQAIIDGMKWLGLDHDGEIVYQFARTPRHAEIAREMVAKGKAFYCYTTQVELEDFRTKNPNAKFRSPYRETSEIRVGVPAVVRLKAPIEGETTIADKVQGTVSIKNNELDDMILLRSDGTPTYMLAVVVDDHDMGITHIIRGDDHHTNSFRQAQIYNAMGWEIPEFAHIPLIHGADGAKLSKRHGALGVDEYRKMGYLPEALRNYLLRLGWSNGDAEIISTEQAIEWFNLESVGKSPSRFDFVKLENLNGHYIREADDARLVDLVVESGGWMVDGEQIKILQKAMNGLKQRAKTIVELANNAAFYITPPQIKLGNGREIISGILPELENCADFTHDELQKICKSYGEKTSQKLGNIMSPLRAAITGATASPSMFEVMEILGKEEIIKRLKNVCL